MPTSITNHQSTARRLVLVDQENLCGGPPKKLPEAGVRLLAAATQGVVGRRQGDHVIVAWAAAKFGRVRAVRVGVAAVATVAYVFSESAGPACPD